MNSSENNYNQFVNQYKNLFLNCGSRFLWEIEVDEETGCALNNSAWIINELTVSKSKVKTSLNNFSLYIEADNGNRVLSKEWKEFLKSEISRRCLECKNSTGLINAVIQAVRLLAAVCNNQKPWLITTQYIKKTYEKALEIQPSGVLAGRVLELAKTPFDVFLLSDFSPITYHIKRAHKASERRKTHIALAAINDRLNSEKLPGAEEFSALVEILSSPPKREIDKVLFPAIKLMLIMGFRLNEVCLIPVDWKSEEIEYDQYGNIVRDEKGAILKTLYIKYYAEKQDKAELYEPRRVPVPHSFQNHVENILVDVEEITFSLREKLKLHEKTKNKKMFTGNQNSFINIEDFGAAIGSIVSENSDFAGAGHHLYMPRERLLKAYNVPRYHINTGNIIPWSIRSPLTDEIYRIAEIEPILIEHFKTKLSDISPAISLGNEIVLKASETLFLLPRKAKAKESSSGWYYDWKRYLFVSKLSPQNIDKALCGKGENENIFKIYLNKSLTLNSHSLRHLRSAELIRAQVSDMIHAKTMGRKRYAQNYEYDHRSVAESLKLFNVNESILKSMPPKALEVLGKISTNQVGGSISNTFKEIQITEGDEHAIEWLSAHADAMHLTPYGVCVANMITNPCPKHLQCFSGCSHFVTDTRPESREMLETLKNRHEHSITMIQKNIANGDFGKVHLEHAETMLANINIALDAIPGTKPFPDGANLFIDASAPKGKTALDQPVKVISPYENR